MESKVNHDKENVSKRILETKRETERLKAELQNLIESGIKSSVDHSRIPNTHSVNTDNTKHSDNKVQIIKSYDPKHSQLIRTQEVTEKTASKDIKINPSKEITNKNHITADSCKKVRNYNVEEAREYIKKQREKRLEQLKSQKKDNLTTAELQKKKLQELQKKSLELVSKNLEAKRERSKSREKQDYVRPDTNIENKQSRSSRAASRQHQPSIKQISATQKKTTQMLNNAHRNMLTEHKHNIDSVNSDKGKNLKDSSVIPIGEATLHNMSKQQSGKSPQRNLDEDCPKTSSHSMLKNHNINTKESDLNQKDDTKRNHLSLSANSKESPVSNKKNSLEQRNPNLLYPPSLFSFINRNNIEENTKYTKNDEVDNKNIPQSSTTLRPSSQHEKKTEYPLWLQDKCSNPDPFNVINCVKRKLQYAFNTENEKPSVEVGVQSSFTNNEKSSYLVEKNESIRSNKHTDLKSFISHKCLNLDPKIVEHIELIPKKSSNNEQSEHSRALLKTSTATESDSDTSKNIPEISSESGTSVKRNAEFVKQSLSKLSIPLQEPLHTSNPKISTERLDNMKLKPCEIKSSINNTDKKYASDSEIQTTKHSRKHSKLNKSNNNTDSYNGDINKIKKNLFADVNEYSSDFQISSDDKCSLSKSRESILTFNCAKVSPNKAFLSPDKHSTQTEKDPLVYLDIPKIITNGNDGLINTETIEGTLKLNTNQSIPVFYPRNTTHTETNQSAKDTNKHSVTTTNIPSGVTTRNNTYSSTFQGTKSSQNNCTDRTNFQKKSKLHISVNHKINSENSAHVTTDSDKSSILPTISLEKQGESEEFVSLFTEFHPSQTLDSNLKSKSVTNKLSEEINTKSDSQSFDSLKHRKDLRNTLYLGSKSESVINNGRDHYESLSNENTFKGHSLKEPTLSLKITDRKNLQKETSVDKPGSVLIENIALQSGDLNNSNQIHLKFEAEIHLLNDFNESLRHFSEAEKAFESLRSKNDSHATTTKILQNRDTQTSVITKSSKTSSINNERVNGIDDSRSHISSINYTRGSEFNHEDMSSIVFDTTLPEFPEEIKSEVSAGFEISKNVTDELTLKPGNKNKNLSSENLHSKNFAGMSLRMFDQLIRDEDVRLENLKTIIKIREKALLDRTKAELSWLEIQRKHLKETGKLQEASLVKKKQRGILVKHQQERHEMQRLKQMQKAASEERKVILKEQRNLIKHQLSTDNMLSKIKVNTPRERRHSGPLKVIQTRSDSVISESSISKKSSTDGEVHSLTSHSYSVVSKISEVCDDAPPDIEPLELTGRSEGRTADAPISQIKRTLLMREATLHKRRKAAEELLQWHKKLLEEEKRIAELESTASSIISKIPNNTNNINNEISAEKYKFKGKQLNQLWLNLTGCYDRKFVEDKVYPMSQIALERFCRSAREYSVKTKKILNKVDSAVKNSNVETKNDNTVSEHCVINQKLSIPNKPDILSVSVETNVEQSEKEITSSSIPSISIGKSYTFDFDDESIPDFVNIQEMDVVDQSKISSINELIDNFSKIKDDISSLSIVQSKKVSENDELSTQLDENSDFLETDKSSSDLENQEPSIIKTKEQKDVLLCEPDIPEGSEKSTISNNSLNLKKLRATEDFINANNNEEIGDCELKIAAGRLNVNKEQVIASKTIKSSCLESKKRIEKSVAIEINKSSFMDNKLNNDKLLSSVPLLETNTTAEDRSKEDTDIEENLVFDDEVNTETSQHPAVAFHHIVNEESDNDTAQGEDIKSLSIKSSQEIESSSNIDILVESHKLTDAESHSNNSSYCSNKSSKLEISDVLSEEKLKTEKSVQQKKDNDKENIVLIHEKLEPLVNKEEISCEEKEQDSLSLSPASSQTAVETEENGEEEKPLSLSEISADMSVKHDSSSSRVKDDNEKNEDSNNTPILDNVLENLDENATESSSSIPDTLAPENGNLESKEPEEYTSEGTDVSHATEKDQELLTSTETVSKSKSSLDKSHEEESSFSTENSRNNPKHKASKTVDVKKRVSEILADANHVSRGDKSPRLQDLYVTTYDLVSPTDSPEVGSPKEGNKTFALGNEAEELLRKQLEIEQEIKQLTELQQKEQLPYLYVREIPNKPPPPYTPPSSIQSKKVISILPGSKEEIEEITKYSAKIIHKAYVLNNLQNISVSENTLNLITKNIDKECYKFVFDLCKEIAREHYKQFEEENVPSWLQVTKKPQLAVVKPLDGIGLEKLMNKKLLEIFGFQKPKIRENAIIKWSRKKRDHVDEILVLESQNEEVQWTNFDKDELLVMNDVTNDIMNILLKDTVDVFNKTLSKKSFLH